jgi:hypothetical protein
MACSKPLLSMMSFDEIVQGRDATVRVIEDSLVDIVDAVMVVTGKNCNDSNELLRDLSPSLFDKEKILTRGRRRYLTLRDTITLIMVLPGKMAKEIRCKFAEIIEKYIQIIEGVNGVPVVHLSADVPVDDLESRRKKARREDLELLKLEHEINSIIVENNVKEHARIKAIQETIESIQDPNSTILDGRTRLMFQDTYLNLLLNTLAGQSSQVKGQAGVAIMNGPSPNKPISIGSVATELGYNPTSSDSKKIGMDLSKRYIQLHGERPTKHDQLCDGRVTSVNSYTEQDRPMVTEALHAYFKPSSA